MMEETRHACNIPDVKKKFSVAINISSLENLRQLSQLLPSEEKKTFTKKYGAILDLLFIPVETSALNVLAQYWSPALRCFELPNIDIARVSLIKYIVEETLPYTFYQPWTLSYG